MAHMASPRAFLSALRVLQSHMPELFQTQNAGFNLAEALGRVSPFIAAPRTLRSCGIEEHLSQAPQSVSQSASTCKALHWASCFDAPSTSGICERFCHNSWDRRRVAMFRTRAGVMQPDGARSVVVDTTSIEETVSTTSWLSPPMEALSNGQQVESSTRSLLHCSSLTSAESNSGQMAETASVVEDDQSGATISSDETATTSLSGDEDEGQLEGGFAELAPMRENSPPAEARQEKDPDPGREYFHTMKLDEIKAILEKVRGRDVEVLYVREKCNFTDYMVVVTGRSERHIRAMAEAVVRELSERCEEIMEGLTPAVEGEPGQEWLAVDAGNIIVHFFTEDERDHYKLEELWGGQTPKKRRYGPYGELLDDPLVL